MSRPKRGFPKFAASSRASEPTALVPSHLTAASSSTPHSNSNVVQPFARPAAPTSISDDNRPLSRPAASALAARPCHPDPIAAPRPRQQQPFDEHFEAAADDEDDPFSRLLVNLARDSVAAANVPSRNSFGEPTRTGQGAAAARSTRSVVPVANPTTSEMTEEELDNLVSDIDPTLFFDEPSTDSHAEHTSVPPQATSLRATRQPDLTIAAAAAAVASEPELDAASECSRPSGASSSYSRSTASSGLGSSTVRGSTTSSKFPSVGAGGRPQAAAVGIVRPMPSSTALNAAASGASSSSAAAGGTAAARFGLSEAPRLGRVAIGCVRPMRAVPPTTSTTPANPSATRRGGLQAGRSSATNARLLNMRGGMFNY